VLKHSRRTQRPRRRELEPAQKSDTHYLIFAGLFSEARHALVTNRPRFLKPAQEESQASTQSPTSTNSGVERTYVEGTETGADRPVNIEVVTEDGQVDPNQVFTSSRTIELLHNILDSLPRKFSTRVRGNAPATPVADPTWSGLEDDP
jgi:hypothetical protein